MEEREGYEQALRRELWDELGVKIHVGDELANMRCSFSYGIYDVHFFRAQLLSGSVPDIKTDENQSFGWLGLGDLENYEWIVVDKAVATLALLEGVRLDV